MDTDKPKPPPAPPPASPLLSPTLDGGRFSLGVLPLDVVPDLLAYQTLLRELSKHLYRQRNRRKHVPRGFDEAIHLSITAINKGSLSLAMERTSPPVKPQTTLPFVTEDYDLLLQDSNDFVARTLASLDSGHGLGDFPPHLLRHLVQVGRSLKPEESFEFRSPRAANSVRLDSGVRRKLIALQADKYESPHVQTGKIVGGDAERGELRLSDNGDTFTCYCSTDEVTRWLRFVGSRVQISGMGEFSAKGVLIRFTAVDQTSLASDAPSIELQFARLGDLKPGWFDQESPAIDRLLLRNIQELLSKLMVDMDIPTPYLYPTPQGGIRAEWSAGDEEISLEASLDEPLFLHMTHVSTGVSLEAECDLARPEQALDIATRFLEPLFP